METNSSGSSDDVMIKQSQIAEVDIEINVGLFGGQNTGFAAPVSTPRKETKAEIEDTLSYRTPEELQAEARVYICNGNIDAAMECYDKWIETDPVDGRMHKGIILAMFSPIRYFEGIGEIAQAALMTDDKMILMALYGILNNGRCNVFFKTPEIRFKNVNREQIIGEIDLYLSADGNKTMQKEIAGRLLMMLMAYIEDTDME